MLRAHLICLLGLLFWLGGCKVSPPSRLERKVVVGHWQDADVQAGVGVWARAAGAWYDAQGMKIARFGGMIAALGVLMVVSLIFWPEPPKPALPAPAAS